MAELQSSADSPIRAGGRSKAAVAYTMVRERIADGTYGPGYRLVIDQLAREIGFSAIPLREAIARLEAEGWVQVIRNVGARVASIDTTAYGQVMQVLARLEGYATAAAAPRLSQSDLLEAAAANHEMTQALVDFDPIRFRQLNRAFHEILCRQCGDAHLYQLLEQEWSRLSMVRRDAFPPAPGRAHASVREHAALLTLLQESGDLDEIESAARQHKLNSLAAVVERESRQEPA